MARVQPPSWLLVRKVGGRTMVTYAFAESWMRCFRTCELCLFSGINDDSDEIINTNKLSQAALTYAGEVPGSSRNGDGRPDGSFHACPRFSGHIPERL